MNGKEKQMNDALRYHDEDEHILVCLSSAPSNPTIIKTAARMANAFRAAFTALFVETPNFPAMSEENKQRLRSNIDFARQLGAQIETVYGEDVPSQIAEFARLSGVSKIVIGRSAAGRHRLFAQPTLTERLIDAVPNIDVHIIPDAAANPGSYREAKVRSKRNPVQLFRNILKCLGILIGASFIGLIFDHLDFTEANIITVYILGVLLIAVSTRDHIYSLISSLISVLVFNFLFTTPRYTFMAYDTNYAVTFFIMFLAAFLTGSLAVRLQASAKQSAQAAYRTKILFDTNQLLQHETEREKIAAAAAGQLIKLLERDVVIYLKESDVLGEPRLFAAGEKAVDPECVSQSEQDAARWVLNNNRHAGATTDVFSEARCLYMAVRVNAAVYGVVGIAIGEKPLDAFEHSIVLSILGECALVLENEKNLREKEEAAVRAKNEQLRANLLRSISHDLRTPLTSISGNASNLLTNGRKFTDEFKERLYSDIYDDSMWLNNLVENLLSITKIEEGRMKLNISSELLDDVITEALSHVHQQNGPHPIYVTHGDELVLVRADVRLIVQVIINIVDNAIKHTPPGSEIYISTRPLEKFVQISIADNGSGIEDSLKEKVFEMFYTGANRVADSRRSLGLGLFLCRSIIEAHGGVIALTDNEPHGAVFSFTLPIGEVNLYE